MKAEKLTGFLGLVFFFAAGITWVAGEAGEGVEGRLAPPDVIALILIGAWLVWGIKDRRLSLLMPKEYRAYLPLLAVYLLGMLFSAYPERAALELVIHVFIFDVSLILFNLYAKIPPERSVPLVLRSVLMAGSSLAVLGLVDFFVWPDMLPGTSNGLTGTFRNTGQAGAFFGMYLAILIPGFLSGFIPNSRSNLLMLATIVGALVFTSKRAALIGLAVGLLILGFSMMLSASKRDKKLGLGMIFLVLLVAPLAFLAFQWGLTNIEGMAWRFGRKFSASSVEQFEEGFLAQNLRATATAFKMNPFVGVGLGNVAGVITAKYEIHSTYLSLLGNAGFLGLAAYVYFMAVHVWQSFRARGKDKYALYLRYYIPMLAGLMIAWAYTYHLRKREFWILFFVVSLVIHGSRRLRRNRV